MRVFLAYLVVIAVWSTTPLAIQWSGDTDWFFGVAARLGISAVLILPIILLFSKQKFDFSFSALKVYFYAALALLGGMTPVYWVAQTMPSGWIALVWGMIPIVTGIMIYFLLGDEKLTWNKWVGVAFGFGGLVALFAPNLDPNQIWLQLAGLGLLLVGITFHSFSTVMVKKTRHNLPPLHVVAGSLWITSLGYLLVNPSVYLSWPELSLREELSIGYLVIIGTLTGFVLYFYVLKHMDAFRLGMIPMITPVFAILLGWLVNNEELNLSIWLGAGLVTLGLLMFELQMFKKAFKKFFS